MFFAQHITHAVAAQRPIADEIFRQLASESPGNPGITRPSYSARETAAHELFASYASAAGCEVHTDIAVNTYMTMPGEDRSLPQVVIGSHLDTVANGGNFDGAAGVVAGLLALRALRHLGYRPPFDISVMAVRAEESAWFQVSYIGSRAALGTLPIGALEAPRVDTGCALADYMAECGADAAAIRRGERHLDPARLRAYLEVHIEQAPSLAAAGQPVGIVTAIPGNFRYPDIRIVGEGGHVGTPRRYRRDAAIAAAEFASTLDRIWEEHEAAGCAMAFTVGRFHTNPNHHAMTIVPGEFALSLDVRAYDDATLAALEQRVVALVAGIEQRRRVRFDLGQRASAPVAYVDSRIRIGLEAAADALDIPWTRLNSPASHDAAAFAAAAVPIGMVFIRNHNGSHHPEEDMAIDDFLEATKVLTWWLVHAAGHPDANATRA